MFKYDYANRKRNICLAFLIFGIIVMLYFVFNETKGLVAAIPFVAMFALASIVYSQKGICVDSEKRTVVIRDDRGKTSFPIDKIRHVSLIEINKINKGNTNLLSLTTMGKEEIEMHDYVYNNGKTYYIIFQVTDDIPSLYYTHKSYFGWMYKEKNKKRVEAKVKELYSFVDLINSDIKKFKQQQILQERALKKQKK